MSTKKETVKEETSDVAKNVNVEMSKEQADEFASFLAKKKDESEKKEVKESKTLIYLVFRHNVNGKKYGPGQTEVPSELVGHFQEYEQRQKNNELASMMNRGRVMELNMAGKVVKSRSSEVNPGF